MKRTGSESAYEEEAAASRIQEATRTDNVPPPQPQEREGQQDDEKVEEESELDHSPDPVAEGNLILTHRDVENLAEGQQDNPQDLIQRDCITDTTYKRGTHVIQVFFYIEIQRVFLFFYIFCYFIISFSKIITAGKQSRHRKDESFEGQGSAENRRNTSMC